MSQVSRQLSLCPGTPRRIRVQDRRLCLCGPGGGGPTCGLCFGRALTGGISDQCGGLFAPFCAIGARYRVEIDGFLVGMADETVDLGQPSQYTIDHSFVVILREDFVIGQDFWPNPTTGSCQALVESYAGAANLVGGQVQISASAGAWGPFSYSLPATTENLYDRYIAPLTLPVPINSISSLTTENLWAYTRPSVLSNRMELGAAFIVEALLNNPAYVAAINGHPLAANLYLGGTTPGSLGWYTGAPFASHGVNYTSVGPGPCAGGSEVPLQSGEGFSRVFWEHSQACLASGYSVIFEREHIPAPGIHLQGFRRSTWDVAAKVTILDQCPGDSPGPNAAAIEAFMAKGRPCAGCG